MLARGFTEWRFSRGEPWLGALLLSVAAAWGSTEEPNADEPAQRWQDAIPRQLLPLLPPVPDDRNAFVLWSSKAPKFERPDEPEDAKGEPLLSDESPFPGGAAGEALESWITKFEPLIALVDEGLQRGGWRSDPENSIQWFNALRFLRPVQLRAKLRFRQGRLGDACDEVVRMARFARLIGAETLLNRRFAIKLVMAASSTAHWLTASRSLPESERLQLMEVVDQLLELSPLAEAFRGDFLLYALSYFNKLPEDSSGPRLGSTIRETLSDMLDSDIGAERMAAAAILEGHTRPFDKAETVSLLGEKVLQLMDLSRRPWKEQSGSLPEAEAIRTVAELWPPELQNSGAFQVPGAESVLAARRALASIDNPLGKLCVHHYQQARTLLVIEAGVLAELRITIEGEAQRALVLAAMGARLDEQRRGETPSTLQEVVRRGALPRLPIDPYDDQPIRYDPARRLVWSVGPDGADDGGRAKPPEKESDDDQESAKDKSPQRWDVVLSTAWAEGR